MPTDNPRTESVPYALTIKAADDPLLWRAYPGPSTTLEELYRACARFNLRCYVDAAFEVCLVGRGNPHQQMPDAAELVACLWGLDTRDHVEVQHA